MPRWGSADDRFWNAVDKGAGDSCWRWTRPLTGNGYGLMNRDGLTWYAHRLSWTMHAGAIPDGQQVLHRCDNPACVRPDHLFLGTAKDNMEDMAKKGRAMRGERHYQAKLTDAAVLAIRSTAATDGVMASALGVSRRTVSHARSRKTWTHVA